MIASKLLLVEDDLRLVEVVASYLSLHQFDVVKQSYGKDAIECMGEVSPDIVVLDIMLPDMDGFEVCKQIRAAGHKVPILMLTARDEDFDRVLGLELGADEYLLKPIQPRVLLAHIRALLRRDSLAKVEQPESEELVFGALRISKSNREVWFRGEVVRLTGGEFDLLWILASNAGSVVSRARLLRALRGIELSATDRSIDTRLYRLRKCFGAIDEAERRIKTVRPNGYLFAIDPWE